MTDDKPTRATPIRPPRSSFLGAGAMAPTVPADNMSGQPMVSMTFVMPRDWHTRFKATAAMRGVSMKDLLIEAFDIWEREQRAKLEPAK